MVTWLQGTNCMAEWHGGGKVLTAKKSRSRERREETGMKIQPSKSPWQWPSLYQLGFTRGIDVIWKYMCGKVFTKQAYNSHLWCQEWKNAKGPSCARELEELVESWRPGATAEPGVSPSRKAEGSWRSWKWISKGNGEDKSSSDGAKMSLPSFPFYSIQGGSSLRFAASKSVSHTHPELCSTNPPGVSIQVDLKCVSHAPSGETWDFKHETLGAHLRCGYLLISVIITV